MPRRNLNGKRAILTGASSGIGWELALSLASKGVSLALVARRKEKLEQLAEKITSISNAAQPLVLEGDITDAGFRQGAIEKTAEHFGGLDILINNAGISAHGRFATASPERMQQIMDVNFFAPVEWTRTALPFLQKGNDPVVVQIGSILGRRGLPHNNEYCASKFAMSGWSESVRPEFAKQGVDVLLVSPGTTDTDFFEHLIEKQGETPWPKQKGVPASKVAAAIVSAIEKRKAEITPNMKGRMLLWTNRLFPRLVDRMVSKWG